MTGEVTSEGQGKGKGQSRIITVLNYDSYQVMGKQEAEKGQSLGKAGANKGQQYKNIKNSKEYNRCGKESFSEVVAIPFRCFLFPDIAQSVSQGKDAVFDFQKIADGSAEQERNQKNKEIGGAQCHLYSHDYGDKSAAGEDDFLEAVLQVLPYQKTYQRTYDYSCAVDEYSKHGSIIEKMTELGKD